MYLLSKSDFCQQERDHRRAHRPQRLFRQRLPAFPGLGLQLAELGIQCVVFLRQAVQLFQNGLVLFRLSGFPALQAVQAAVNLPVGFAVLLIGPLQRGNAGPQRAVVGVAVFGHNSYLLTRLRLPFPAVGPCPDGRPVFVCVQSGNNITPLSGPGSPGPELRVCVHGLNTAPR